MNMITIMMCTCTYHISAPQGNGVDGGYPIISTLMDRIQDADDESSSMCDFGFRVYDIFCGSCELIITMCCT